MSKAPVCHIPPKNIVATPGPQNVPGILPTPAANVQALQQAVANLQQIVIFLSGQGSRGPSGQNANSKPARWTEDRTLRITTTVRVYQDNDPTSQNWVDVDQINQIGMKDGVTGESWTWKRAGDAV